CKCLASRREVRMRRAVTLAMLAGTLIAASVQAQTAIELKKELLPKMKKAEAEGKDLGQAKQFYDEGDKLLKDGMQDEAAASFKKARDAMPKGRRSSLAFTQHHVSQRRLDGPIGPRRRFELVQADEHLGRLARHARHVEESPQREQRTGSRLVHEIQARRGQREDLLRPRGAARGV